MHSKKECVKNGQLYTLFQQDVTRLNVFDGSVSCQCIFIMAGPVKSFQSFQKFHQIIGLNPSRSFFARRTLFLIGEAVLMVPSCAYLLFEAKSMFAYGYGFFVVSCTFVSFAIYLIYVWQLENILKYIESCDEFIAKSKKSANQSNRSALS